MIKWTYSFHLDVAHTKACLICGKLFQSEAHNARYCSRECKLEVKRRRNKADRGPLKHFKRECECCGKSFETRVANKKFCSQECYRSATIERKRVKRGISRSRAADRVSGKEAYLGLCSVCGAENTAVAECRECGFLSCEYCHNQFGICPICSDV